MSCFASVNPKSNTDGKTKQEGHIQYRTKNIKKIHQISFSGFRGAIDKNRR